MFIPQFIILFRRPSMWLLRRLVLLILHFPAVSIARPFNNSISAIFIFGDSTVDSGNNNYITTPCESNFPPYGTDFADRIPTGRFSDGRLVSDFIASYVGIKEYLPPYLDPTLRVEDLITGVCFASACSGFDPLTAQLPNVIPIQTQLEYFREYKTRIEVAVGKERMEGIINKAVYWISAGSNDIVYGTQFLRKIFDTATYQQLLLQSAQQLIQGLIEEGARRIAVAGLPTIGCLPLVVTTSSGDPFGRRRCTDSLSSIALDYNLKLQNMLKTTMENSDSMIIYADIYKPLNDMITNPSKYGFEKVNIGCCGSGLVETAVLCNAESVMCNDPSKYVFFDSFHPSEAANNYIFQALLPTVDLLIKN